MKRLVFRFDVDTPKCVQQGIPNLLRLSKKHKVKFTFFVHFGRSISQIEFLHAFIRPEKDDTAITHLSAYEKLGLKDYLTTAFLNPQIGTVGSGVLQNVIRQGHEIGLHGGTNHELWNRHALRWNSSTIEKEISWGINQMQRIHPKYKMMGFASPHWKGNRKIYRILKNSGFSYISDIHTDKALQKINLSGVLPNIPNNISGEPGGVGYIEWCRAKKMTDTEILTHFETKLKKRRILATVYDHPYYSGVTEIKLLEKMILLAKKQNFEIVTLGSIVKNI